jgi:hypothetical protein
MRLIDFHKGRERAKLNPLPGIVNPIVITKKAKLGSEAAIWPVFLKNIGFVSIDFV